MRRCVCAAVAASLVAAGSAEARPAEVTVINTAANPVFVTPTGPVQVTAASALPVLLDEPVTITVNRPLPVEHNGPVTVQGALGGPVQTSISGTPTVRPVQEVFDYQGRVTTTTASRSCATFSSAIPAGRKLILTQIDIGVNDTVEPTVELNTFVNIPNGGFAADFAIDLQQAPGTTLYSAFVQTLRRISPQQTAANTAQTGSICVRRGAGDAEATAHFNLAGYLE